MPSPQSTAHPEQRTRPRWFRLLRGIARYWYLAFLILPANIAFNLITLVANDGPDALGDSHQLSKALLLDQLLRVLRQAPLVVVPVVLLIALLTLLGRLAHQDVVEERRRLDATRQGAFIRDIARTEAQAAAQKEGMRTRGAAARAPAPSLIPPPEPPSKDPQGPPRDQIFRSGHFVGRAEELDALLTRLRRGGAHSVIALQGMGGIGKTSLAAEAVYWLEREDAFPDGVGVISAQEKTNAITVLREALARFDPYRRPPAASTLEKLAQAAKRLLEGKRTLIVIDNVEPGLSVEQVVTPLVEAGATLLLTARQAVPAAIPLVLGYLSEDEAIELFAKEYGMGAVSDLTPGQHAAIKRIITRLGCLTIAVKLAARDAADSPQDLASYANELGDHVLTIPGATEDYGGMELIFAKSMPSLPGMARNVFAAFATFATAEFGRQAALAVAAPFCGAEDAALLLALLVRRALISEKQLTDLPEAADADRLQFHPILLDFARRELESLGEQHATTARTAMAAFYATYCTTAPRDAFAPDEQNIEGALNWAHDEQRRDENVAEICVGMQAYWRDYGRMTARERYLPWGLEAATRLAGSRKRGYWPTRLALLRLGYAQLMRLKGKLDEAERTSKGILPVFRKNHSVGGEGSTLILLGNIARDRSRLEMSEQYYRQALHLFTRLEDRTNIGLAYTFLGQVIRQHGTRLEEAEHNLLDGMRVYDSIPSPWGRGLALQQLARISLQRARFHEARERNIEALAIHQRLQSRRAEAVDISISGVIAFGEGHYQAAEDFYAKSLDIRLETGDRRGEAIDLALLGQLHRILDHVETADSYLARALALWNEMKAPAGIGWVRAEQGQLALRNGDLATAKKYLEDALSRHRAADDVPAVALALRVLGQIARIAGRDKTASDQLNEALALARQVEDPILASRTLRELAKLAVSQGDLASAETFLNQSLEIVLAVSAPLEIAEAREDLGTFSVEFQRDEPHGRELLAQAAQDYDTLGLTRRPAERFVLSR